MAGHSKWANIQHRKGRQDARRGKLFTQLIREITVAAKLGGDEPGGNPRLRAAIDSALSKNMPKDTVTRAIRRGAGGGAGEVLDEARYEGYGPGGVAILIECMTDNKNRTVAELRHTLSKHGGNLGTDGCVSYLFTKLGLLSYQAEVDEEQLLEQALEAGAEDVISHEDGSVDVVTRADDFFTVREVLQNAGFPAAEAGLVMRASATTTLDSERAQGMLKLVDALEELDDVQQVWSNADILDEELAGLSGA